MPNYPFQRAKPLGWAMFEALTSSQMNAIDQIAAQAADGLTWTDIAAMRNWSAPATVTQAGSAGCYVSGLDAWWLFGVNAGAMTNALCPGGGGVFSAGISSPDAGISSIASRACAYDVASNAVVVGVTPSASSNQKFRRAVLTPAASFAATASSQTNTNGIGVIEYVPGITPVLVAGHLGNGVVETSYNGGAAWTVRGTPNTDPRVSAAVGPSGIVMSSSASTNKVIQSSDGINWFERTLPLVRSWSNVVYVPLLGQYVAMSDGLDAIAYSSDGVTWASRAFTLPLFMTNTSGGNEQKFVAFGRNIYGCMRVNFANNYNVFTYSQDGGVSWKVAGLAPLNATIGTLRTNGRQMLYAVGTNVMLSVATGF